MKLRHINKKKVMKNKFLAALKKVKSYLNFLTLLKIVRILELFILWSTIIFIDNQLNDIIYGKTFPLEKVWYLFLAFGILYTLLVSIEFFKEKIDVNRIIALMTFMIFCFSLFAGITIFNSNQPSVSFPQLPNGTVGLRTYECKVAFKEIEISFLDSNNVWQKIPSKVTNNKKNWKKAFNTFGDLKPYNNLNELSDSSTIILRNSGIIFDPTKPEVSKYFKNAKYFKVSTIIKVDSSTADYADIQICLNVPILNNMTDSEELYVGLSLPVKNIDYAKIWIPALDWATGYSYRDPVSKIKKNGVGKSLQLNKDYNFIGVSFHKTVRIILKNKDISSIICESKLE